MLKKTLPLLLALLAGVLAAGCTTTTLRVVQLRFAPSLNDPAFLDEIVKQAESTRLAML